MNWRCWASHTLRLKTSLDLTVKKKRQGEIKQRYKKKKQDVVRKENREGPLFRLDEEELPERGKFR